MLPYEPDSLNAGHRSGRIALDLDAEGVRRACPLGNLFCSHPGGEILMCIKEQEPSHWTQ